MGSYSYTCTVSGLPIEAGDEVRYFLLSASPYDDCHTMNGRWFPRCFPLQASYNDYGGVENVKDEISKELWIEGFKIDLISRGWGDNTCHDVPTSKNMSFESLLNAVRENRILVNQNIEYPVSSIGDKYRLIKHKTPKGVPTMQRIKTIIKNNNLPLNENFCEKGYILSKIHTGVIKVRWEGYDSNVAEEMSKLQKHLDKYATIVKAGAYNGEHELLIFPKVGTKDYHGYIKNKKKKMLVQQAMIREDVWQALCKTTINLEFERMTVDVGFFKDMVHKYWEECNKEYKKLSLLNEHTTKDSVEYVIDRTVDNLSFSWKKNSLVKSFVEKDSIPFTVGLGTNWRLMLKKYVEGKFDQQQVGLWLDSVAEFVFIHMILMPVRYWWRPSYSCGPQFGEWEKHVQINTIFSEIAKDMAEKQEKENKEYDY